MDTFLRSFSCKVAIIILILLVTTSSSYTQIAGNFEIPGTTFPTIRSAIVQLNTIGVGTGGVVFNVSAGYTETFQSSSDGLITATGTSANPILFQKSGLGANPVITAGTGAGMLDGIIVLSGTDYITFDGIDLKEKTSNITAPLQMEWGYALLKKSTSSPFNGCQYVVIKNCVVELNKINVSSEGIHIYNHTLQDTTSLNIADASDANSFIVLDNIKVQNSFSGILFRGFSSTPDNILYDQSNTVNNCTIQNFGGASANAYGIKSICQNNIVIQNNNVNNISGGGSPHTSNMYGIMNAAVNVGNFTARHNTISLTKGNNSGDLFGLYNTEPGTTILSQNILTNFSVEGGSGTVYFIYNTSKVYATIISIDSNSIGNSLQLYSTGALYGIYNQSISNVINIRNNIISDISLSAAASSSVYGYYNSGTGTGGTEIIANNTVSNINAVSPAALFGIFSSTSNIQTKDIHDNSVFNINSQSGAGSVYGILSNSSGVNNIYFNNINTFTCAGSTYGIRLLAGKNSLVYSNIIHNLTCNGSSSAIHGLYGTGTGTQVYSINIFKNKLYNLTAGNPSSSAYGIFAAAGRAFYIYNNFISDLKTPAASGTSTVNGLFIIGSGTVGAYYNSIFLNAASSSTTTFGSSGIYALTSAIVDLKNNNIVNLSAHVGNGLTVAFRRNNNTLTSYEASSNGNNFYAGNASTNNLIFYDGTNSFQTLDFYKAFVSPRDLISVSGNVAFVNSGLPPYDLHINNAVPTFLESGGVPMVSPLLITKDFDEDLRDILTPDIGADEFNGISVDLIPPSIIYTPFNNTSSTLARTLTVRITDTSGVPVSGIGMPRLFWNKNGGAYNSVTGVLIGNNLYNFSFGAGTSIYDSVSYYIIAQDAALNPNVGGFPSLGSIGFTPNPPAVSVPPINPSSYKIIGYLNGTYNIPGDFANLTEASNLLNTIEMTGNVTFILKSSYTSETEVFPIVFNPNIGSDPTRVLTIKPGTNANVTISTYSGGPIFQFNGFDYAVIDGSNNGSSSRNLTIRNGNPTIFISSLGASAGSTFITIKNCIISSNGTAIRIGSYDQGDDNDNITIQNNYISGRNYSIVQAADLTGIVDNLQIKNNTITSLGDISSGSMGICIGISEAPLIEQNEIFNIVSGPYPGSSIGIALNNVSHAEITRNNIHDIISHNDYGDCGAYGINISGNSSVGNRILNNVIYNVLTTKSTGYSTDYNPFGIRIDGGREHKIYYNSIHMSGNQTNVAGESACILINKNTVTDLDIRNNVFKNSLTRYSPSCSYAIYVAQGTVLGTINNNDYYCSGPSAMLGYFNGYKSTLSEWQSATGQDPNSISLDPLFIRENDLRINEGSPLLNSGVPIQSVTFDFRGVARNLISPTIGAFEKYTTIPAISYPVLNDSFPGVIHLKHVIITDPDGIASGSLKPRIYWKRNSGNWTSSPAINNESPFSFSINATGFWPGDTIRYYIIAQDILGDLDAMPNNGFRAADVNTVTVHPTNPNYFLILVNSNYGGGGTANGSYYFANSTIHARNAPSQPAYTWIDPIPLEHQEITLWNTSGDDGVSDTLNIPFNFNYFDILYTKLYVCSNGWVSFTNLSFLPDSVRRSAVAIPVSGGIENYIAAALCNLDVRTNIYPDAHVYYGINYFVSTWGTQKQFVITFWHAHKYGTANDYLTFQIILKENGNIKIQYNKSESSFTPVSITNYSTVGIENSNGTKGIQYRYNSTGALMLDSTSIAIEFGKSAYYFPVELTSFSASSNERAITLNWETKTELNLKSFRVERLENELWNFIGEIKAKGNSTEPVKYYFTDNNLNSGKVYYRLRMVDLDGSEKFSNIIEAEIELPKTYKLSQNYPNPFNPTTKIQYQLPVAAKVIIEVYSIVGEKLFELVNAEQQAGYYTLEINNFNNLASGVYIYKMIAADKLSGNNFVNIKKMIFLK